MSFSKPATARRVRIRRAEETHWLRWRGLSHAGVTWDASRPAMEQVGAKASAQEAQKVLSSVLTPCPLGTLGQVRLWWSRLALARACCWNSRLARQAAGTTACMSQHNDRSSAQAHLGKSVDCCRQLEPFSLLGDFAFGFVGRVLDLGLEALDEALQERIGVDGLLAGLELVGEGDVAG